MRTPDAPDVSYEISGFGRGSTPSEYDRAGSEANHSSTCVNASPRSAAHTPPVGNISSSSSSRLPAPSSSSATSKIAGSFEIAKPIALIAVHLALLSKLYDAAINQGQFSLLQSVGVPACVTATYLLFIYAYSRLPCFSPTLRRQIPGTEKTTTRIRTWMLSYNIYQVLLNAYVVLELCREVSPIVRGRPLWGTQLLPSSDPKGRRLAFLIFVHAENKIVELADTVFMAVRGKHSQITSLHLWHHMLLLWSWYLVVRFACGGDAWFGAAVNSATHVLLYGYYALTLLGWPCPWKRIVTQVQLLQVAVCTCHGVYCLVHGNYPRWLCVLELFVQCNMLFLFGRFYRAAYNGDQPCKVCVSTEAAGACVGDASDMAKDILKGVAGQMSGQLDAPQGGKGGAAIASKNRRDGAKTAESKFELPIYTLREVNQHRFMGDAWAVVGNRILDITSFIPKHPGGDVISLAAGIDATILFHTYHPNGVAKSHLERMTIGRLSPQQSGAWSKASGPGVLASAGKEGEGKLDEKVSPSSYYSWSSPFYTTLRKRVVERLRSLKRPRRGGAEIWIKAAILMITFWASLTVMILSGREDGSLYWSRAVPASMLMGAAASFIGTCIQHDGNHGAFSKLSWLNTLSGWTLDMIGASAFTWEIQHMLGHHPYTNLLDADGELRKKNAGQPGAHANDEADSNYQESDPDVFSSFPLMRMHPSHSREWFHAYQHLYAPFLFAFMTLSKVFQQDWEMYNDRALYHISAEQRYAEWFNRFRFVGMKVLSAGYMMLLPIWFHGLWRGLGLFILGHCVCGEMLATMFIVNHVIEGVAFAMRTNTAEEDSTKSLCGGSLVAEKTIKSLRPTTANGKHYMGEKSSSGIPANDWAAVQCQTSVNWSSGSWFWNHFSGGLNHQIEHHLFPSICHTNYVHIQDVVQSTCEEFGVPYRSEENLWAAYWAMISHLRNMGNCDSHASWEAGL